MSARLAILYEHPQWFEPLFSELRRRGIAWEPWDASAVLIDPERTEFPDLVFNRMSPSAWRRNHGHAVFSTLALLEHLEARGVEVVNGSRAYALEISKSRQIDLMRRCGVAFPRTRLVNHPSQLVPAAEGLRYPVLVKPNCAGSGAGIRLFESPAQLAAEAATLDFGPDSTALVQEYIAPRGGAITRIEILNGEFLYAIRIQATCGDFNLCPAQSTLAAERVLPEQSIIDDALNLARTGRLDIAGFEYLADDLTGRNYFYDINALSNFVAGAPRLLGFCPTARTVDFIERRLAGVQFARPGLIHW